MKVLVNGGLNLSELDGWWAEAYKPQVGWALGDGAEHDDDPNYDAWEAEQLYRILEDEVAPAFYQRDAEGIATKWVTKMRTSMSELTPRFSSNRMLREYVERLYLPSYWSFSKRRDNNGLKAASLCHWKKSIKNNWQSMRFGQADLNKQDGQYFYRIPLFFEGIDPENITVQLYADPQNGEKPEIYPMTRHEHLNEPENGYYFSVHFPIRRKISDYTPRVVPFFDGTETPIDANHILWKE